MSSTSSKLRVFTSSSAFHNPQCLRLFMCEKGIDLPGDVRTS